jgi:hypothetical protein
VSLADRFATASQSDGPGTVPAQHRCTDTDTNAAIAPSLRLEGHRSVDVSQYPDEHDLNAQLTTTFSAVDGSERRLLLDFFAEARRLGTRDNCEAAVRLARDWVEGTGARWGLREVLCGREDLLAEIDRDQRWSSHGGGDDEEREVGVVVAGLVIDQLVRELVNDLVL